MRRQLDSPASQASQGFPSKARFFLLVLGNDKLPLRIVWQDNGALVTWPNSHLPRYGKWKASRVEKIKRALRQLPNKWKKVYGQFYDRHSPRPRISQLFIE